MSTTPTEDEARERAAGITATLLVRKDKAGRPYWDAKWRDAGGRQVMRRVGPAWLDPGNPFLETGSSRERRRAASWEKAWTPRKGRPKDGALDERAAHARAAELVIAHEGSRDEAEAVAVREAQRALLFETAADSWLQHRVVVGGIKESTRVNYGAMIRRKDAEAKKRGRAPRALIMRRFEGMPLADITTDHVDDFLTDLDEDAALSARSVNAHRQVLSMIFAHAMKKGQVSTNPVSATERRREADPVEIVTYSAEEVEAIARALDGGRHRDPRAPAKSDAEREARRWENATDACAVRIAAFAGLRQGEVCALRWRDIQWTAERMVVQRSYSFGEEVSTKGRRARSVPMAPQVQQALATLRERPHFTRQSDLVFASRLGTFLDPSALRRRYNRARDIVKAENDDLPVLRFHDLRHTFGTFAASTFDLVNVQALMGHADSRTTSRYLHARPAADDAARLGRAIGGLAAEITPATQKATPK